MFCFYFFLPEDDVQKVVSLSVDGKESQLVFIDHAHTDMSVGDKTQAKQTGLAKKSLVRKCDHLREFAVCSISFLIQVVK